jgi:hypothetical protein
MLAESFYIDPVVAEIHEVRRHLLEASGGDVAEFRRRLRERQQASGRKVVAVPLKKRADACNAVEPRSAAE